MHRRLWTAAKVTVGFLVALFGLVGSVYGIWGPPWPTEPSFEPGVYSGVPPFDVPFKVTNKSVFFDLKNLTISCDLVFAKYSRNNIFRNNNFFTPGVDTLKAGDMRSLICTFGRSVRVEDTLVEAIIDFASEYDSPWPWGGRVRSISNRFTFVPSTGQWTPGTPLNY